jgi:hypothetical protein
MAERNLHEIIQKITFTSPLDNIHLKEYKASRFFSLKKITLSYGKFYFHTFFGYIHTFVAGLIS